MAFLPPTPNVIRSEVPAYMHGGRPLDVPLAHVYGRASDPNTGGHDVKYLVLLFFFHPPAS